MDIVRAIEERRSINFFEPGETVPDDTLKKLLELANLSPSSFNLQPWRVIAVRDPERKKALRKCAMNQQKVEEATVVLIIVADPDGVEKNMDRVLESWISLGYMKADMKPTYAGMMNALYGEKGSLTRKIFAVKNASLYAMTLMMAAKGLGLETHPMDGFDEACVKNEFNIPEDKLVPMLVAVGRLKKGVNLLPRAFRRALDEFVSYESY